VDELDASLEGPEKSRLRDAVRRWMDLALTPRAASVVKGEVPTTIAAVPPTRITLTSGIGTKGHDSTSCQSPL
jgi:hypothetical protein